MKTTHRARVRYLASPAKRAAWRMVATLPTSVRIGMGLGSWFTSVGEWAYCHSGKCQCQPCEVIRDTDRQLKELLG